MAPDVLAMHVAPRILGASNASYIRKGTGASMVWLLHAVGPRKMLDSPVKSRVGFYEKSRVCKIYERGQQLAEAFQRVGKPVQ